MKRFLMVLTSILLVGLMLWGIFCFAPIPFVQKWRNIWIETAMSTTSFQWLADKLMPPVVVDAVMEERVESEVIVQDIEVVEDDTYFDALLKLSAGDKDSAGFTIYKVDKEQEIVITDVSDTNFRGKMAIIGDPSRVFVGDTSGKGSRGTLLCDLLKEHDSVLGINASGFCDANGKGSGGVVVGQSRSEGDDWGVYQADYNTIGFNEDNQLLVGIHRNWDAENLRDAVQFNPVLIADGEQNVRGTAGWGLQPRTAIGQREDGVVLMLVIDGRQPGHSIGATMEDMVKVFQKYEALNAAACDGGSSSVMAYDGKIITKCSSPMKTGRYLPNAFLVKRIETE